MNEKEIRLTVPGMSCGHCRAAVAEEVSGVHGVENVDVNLETKVVTVKGEDLDPNPLRAAVESAGYEVAG